MPRRNAVRSNASKSCSFFVLVGLMQSSLVYREKRLNKDLNDKYGMLSENGSTKIPVKYDDFGYLKDDVNVYSVKLSGKYFYINDRNEIIKRPNY